MAEPNRQSGENEERIIEIEIERLRPFKEHPFQVKDDKVGDNFDVKSDYTGLTIQDDSKVKVTLIRMRRNS